MPEDEFNRDGWCESHRLGAKAKKSKGMKRVKGDYPTEFDRDGWCEEHRLKGE